MSTQKMLKSKKNNKGKAKGHTDPGPGTIVYRGPVVTPSEKKEEKLETYVVGYNGTVTSSAAGVINNVYANGQTQLSNCANWASIAGSYAECRILAWKAVFFPYNRYSKSIASTEPGVRTLDRANGTALTSTADGQVHESCKMMSLEDPWTETIRMQGVEESSFQPITTFAAVNWIKLYASSVTISTSFGQVFLTYRIQVRGHPS